MYETSDDRYCYEGSSVLKNRQDLRTQIELSKFEKFATAQRADEPLPAGRLDYKHYRAIHHHLFQDVYTWAGSIRTIRIGKDDNWFCFPEYIELEMKRLFDGLADDNFLRDLTADEFAGKAAHFVAELNAIHPFREGNGRTQNVFLLLLAEAAGHPLDMQKLDPLATLQAMIESFQNDEAALADVILSVMRASPSTS